LIAELRLSITKVLISNFLNSKSSSVVVNRRFFTNGLLLRTMIRKLKKSCLLIEYNYFVLHSGWDANNNNCLPRPVSTTRQTNK